MTTVVLSARYDGEEHDAAGLSYAAVMQLVDTPQRPLRMVFLASGDAVILANPAHQYNQNMMGCKNHGITLL